MKSLLARYVAHDLFTVLEKAETSVHWVSVVGEDSIEPKPQILWPSDNPIYSVAVQHGFSEGMLVYVYAQSNRYEPENVVPMLRIKMLTSMKKLMSELPVIIEYFDQFPELAEKLAEQSGENNG